MLVGLVLRIAQGSANSCVQRHQRAVAGVGQRRIEVGRVEPQSLTPSVLAQPSRQRDCPPVPALAVAAQGEARPEELVDIGVVDLHPDGARFGRGDVAALLMPSSAATCSTVLMPNPGQIGQDLIVLAWSAPYCVHSVPLSFRVSSCLLAGCPVGIEQCRRIVGPVEDQRDVEREAGDRRPAARRRWRRCASS